MISDWDLMQIHVSALYRHDDRQRLLAVNEPGDPRPDDPLPPRLFSAAPAPGVSGGSATTSPLVDRRAGGRCSAPNQSRPISLSHRDASQQLQAALARDAPLSGDLEWTRLAFSGGDTRI